VRSGCLTCKKRRVKCDEGRPLCRRCVTQGYVCDGYAPSIAPLVFEIATDPAERRAFAYFKERAMWNLQSLSGLGLFQKLALPAAYREPVIRRILAALGTHDEASEAAAGNLEKPDMRLSALRFYGEALESMRTGLAHIDPNHVIVAATLFAIFAGAAGQNTAASNHAKNAVVLGQEFQRRGVTLEPSIERLLFFMEKNVQGLQAKFPTPPSEPLNTALTIDLKWADKDLRLLTLETLSAAHRCWISPGEPGPIAAASEILEKIKKWQKRFHEYCGLVEWKCDCKVSFIENAISVLTGWNLYLEHELVSAIQASSTGNITANDNFDEWIRHGNVVCEAAMNHMRGTGSTMSDVRACVGFDFRCKELLTLMGLRCRHPNLRRFITRLLRIGPFQEHQTNGAPANADLVRAIMEYEEAFVDAKPVTTSTSIPGHVRVHVMKVLSCERQGKRRSQQKVGGSNGFNFRLLVLKYEEVEGRMKPVQQFLQLANGTSRLFTDSESEISPEDVDIDEWTEDANLGYLT
jgi:hypothetical protein